MGLMQYTIWLRVVWDLVFVLGLCRCSWCVGGVLGLGCAVGVGCLFGGWFSGLC